jgi:hypothetical protein
VSAGIAARRAAVLAASALGINSILGPIAHADTTWNNPSGGNFSNTNDWSNGIPNSTVNAWFDLDSTAGYTLSFTSNEFTNNLEVDNDTLNFNLGGEAYTLEQNANIGGVINLADADGNLTLSNGTFSAQNINLGVAGGTGILAEQTATTLNATSVNVAGSGGNGTLGISGGTLSTRSITVSSGGSYSQSAGTVIVNSSADFSNASSFAFTGGNLSLNDATFNPLVQSTPYNYGAGTGTFDAWSISGASAPTLSLNAGSTNNVSNQIAVIGNSGNSGTVHVGAPVAEATPNSVLDLEVALFIGLGGANSASVFTPGTGTLNIGFGGQLTVPEALIGYLGGQGSMSIQGGGIASVSSLYVGNSDYDTAATGTQPSTGNVTLAGGSGLVSSTAYIGDGTATGTVTIGTSTVTDNGSNWINAGTVTVSDTGTVNIYAGTMLNTNALQNNGGSVILSGGTIVAATLGLQTGSGQGLVWTSGAIDITGSIADSPSVTVPGTGRLVFEQNTTAVTTLKALSITSGGVVNLNNNHIFIDYGSGTDPKAAILGYLFTGANGGAWNGPGINSSAANSNPNYGIGFADGADGVDSSLTSGEIEIAYAQYGDITLSGLVNANDFHILTSNFGQVVTGGWEDGDFLYSGAVNAEDFHLLTENFGLTETGENVSMPASDWAAIDAFAAANGLAATTNVPEPMSIGLVVLAGAGALRRRRRI